MNPNINISHLPFYFPYTPPSNTDPSYDPYTFQPHVNQHQLPQHPHQSHFAQEFSLDDSFADQMALSRGPDGREMGEDGDGEEWEGEDEVGDGEVKDESGTQEAEPSRSTSTDSIRSLGKDDGSSSNKKKPRVTLPRGRACVACRTRKLKCSGEKPCSNCHRVQSECRYEEIARRKPRGVLMEERVVELEQRLLALGETLPPSKLSSRSNSATIGQDPGRTTFAGSMSISPIAQPPTQLHLSVQPPGYPSMNSGGPDIAPCSALEFTLINFVLPYTPHLLIPLHQQRFLALIALPPSDAQRPHPALLYILFAEAARILEAGIPPPNPPPMPHSLFAPSQAPHINTPASDPTYMLSHVRGMSLALLERARVELDRGIRSVDRPFDLARAGVGIARYLYSLGRFIEGWNVPVARLIVSCGLHRNTGTIIFPTNASHHGVTPPKYAEAYQYAHNHSQPSISAGSDALPILRMRPVIIPPARDEIDVAERVMAFWAAKMQDWEAGIGWGWSLGMSDEECTTQWPWGSGSVEVSPPGQPRPFYNLADLHDLHSTMHTSNIPDTTSILAIKSLGLLHRASHLFDLPISSVPSSQSPRPTHIPPLGAVQAIEAALSTFRHRLPLPFLDHNPQDPLTDLEPYDGPSDPWWIMLHANLYTAEMMMYKEMAHHTRSGYDAAVSCARAFVKLVQRIRPEQWCHVDMIVALNMSLAARFLNKEAQRLAAKGQGHAAKMASEEAEVFRVALARDYSKFLPMASLHALIIQRVREGWPEKEGEYERV